MSLVNAHTVINLVDTAVKVMSQMIAIDANQVVVSAIILRREFLIIIPRMVILIVVAVPILITWSSQIVTHVITDALFATDGVMMIALCVLKEHL